MGSKTICDMVWVVVWMFASLSFHSQGSNIESLNSLVYDYASKARPRTGRLSMISLPSNYSGMEISVIRLRTHSLWMKGADLGFFEIPPRILPWPFTKRVDLVYQNLGNWSSLYYDVPNHVFVAPVIGLLTYDPNTSYGLIQLSITGDNPITVRFPNILQAYDDNTTMKCVRFDTNGTVELTDMDTANSCTARAQGHFSVVIPSPHFLKKKKKKKKGHVWKWWVIGFAVGVPGLILLVLIWTVAYKYMKNKRIKKMEMQSERSEGLETIWIGRSRMPSAAGIRTQPVLENSYVP